MTDAALVQSFIRFYLVPVLISDANQKQPSLSAVNSDLPDNFIEALVVELLADGADSYLFGLFGNQFFVQILLKLDDLYFGGGCGEDGLDPELSIFGSMLFGRKYFAEDIFGVMNFLIFFCFFGLSGFAGAHKDGR